MIGETAPSAGSQPFEGAEAHLVLHSRRAFDPIAEVHVRQPFGSRAADMVEDDVVPKSAAAFVLGVVEAVDHRQPVALVVCKAGTHKASGPSIPQWLPIFNDKARNRRVFHHIGEVDFVHRGHPAAGMAQTEVALQQIELLARRPRAAFADNQIIVAAQNALLGARGLELARHHPHGNARLAARAAWPVRNRLTATEADPPKRVVKLRRMRALELREDLALRLTREIRARRRARHIEARKTNRCRHVPAQPPTN